MTVSGIIANSAGYSGIIVKSNSLGDGSLMINNQGVDATVESFRGKVPLIKMEWETGLKSWADK